MSMQSFLPWRAFLCLPVWDGWAAMKERKEDEEDSEGNRRKTMKRRQWNDGKEGNWRERGRKSTNKAQGVSSWLAFLREIKESDSTIIKDDARKRRRFFLLPNHRVIFLTLSLHHLSSPLLSVIFLFFFSFSSSSSSSCSSSYHVAHRLERLILALTTYYLKFPWHTK